MTLKKIAVLAFSIVLVLWAATPLVFLRFAPDWASRAQIADTFGAINALFSGLALAGVILAIVMQKEELSLQREELVATRTELRRSAEAQEASSEAMRKQVETLLLTAQLNALSTLTSHYASSKVFDPDFTRQTRCTGQIRKILFQLGIDVPA